MVRRSLLSLGFLASLLAACPAPVPVVPGDADGGRPQDDAGPSTVQDAGGADAGLDAGSLPDAGPGPLTPAQEALLAARPYRLVVPDASDGGAPRPFLLSLHGYSSNGLEQDLYMGLSALAEAKGFILATPDGTLDTTLQRFWNATDACCNLYGATVDDVAYLTAILDDVRLKYRVDPKRVFVLGHSNGAFMAHRLACEKADRIAGIVALAGENWSDADRCQPSAKVAVLQVHGTLDAVIAYGGGANVGRLYPGSPETIAGWAARNGCSSTPQSAGGDLNLDLLLWGDETQRVRFENCQGGAAELWTIQGGSHIPSWTSSWPEAPWGFLMAHPKP